MPIMGRILGVGLLLAAASPTAGRAVGVGADGTAGPGPVTVGLGHFLSGPIVRIAGGPGQPGILAHGPTG